MAHFITDTCIGCTACVRVCPTDAISGERKELHVIDPDLCIDCGACENACPVECIENAHGVKLPRIAKRADWPKPVVSEELCTGCHFCVDVCPFDCLELTGPQMMGIAELVKPMQCVACYQCEEVCAKGAIQVLPPALTEMISA